MDNKNENSKEVPELDSATTSRLLNNVFAECNYVPNTIPLETLESWGNYKKTDFRRGRRISYVILVILVLFPMFFFKPTIIAQRTNVNSTGNAVYEIQVKTLIPVRSVYASIGDRPLTLEKVNSRNYIASVPQNGSLKVDAVSLNGQHTQKSFEVSYIDTEKPELVKAYNEGNKVNIVIRDTYSGINYDDIVGTDTDGNKVEPISIDKESETIVFELPSKSVTVNIPDNSGNELQILLSPK